MKNRPGTRNTSQCCIGVVAGEYQHIPTKSLPTPRLPVATLTAVAAKSVIRGTGTLPVSRRIYCHQANDDPPCAKAQWSLIADWRRVWEPAGNAAAGSVAPANHQPQIGVAYDHAQYCIIVAAALA